MPALRTSQLRLGNRTRGFTAIEIAMVATVIAIFALIVLPIFRNRVDEAKLAAARSDLNSFYKALTLSEADCGFFVRLEDLIAVQDNTPATIPAAGITNETPIFAYPSNNDPAARRTFNEQEWRNFAGPSATPKWKGPYVTFQRSILLGDMLLDNRYDPFLRSKGGTSPQVRAIQDYASGSYYAPLHDSDQKRIPIDPWGNPYMFFPPDKHVPNNETGYANSWLVSLGPDGLPGAGNTNYDDFLRVPGTVLGSGDDLVVQF